MKAHFPVGVAKSLQSRDLFALLADDSGDDDVQQKDATDRKMAGAMMAIPRSCADLIAQVLVRGLLLAKKGSHAAEGFQQSIQLIDDFKQGIAAKGQFERDAIECPSHVEGGF